jgi:hypothetical protein
MSTARRALVVLVASLALVLVWASPAVADHCGSLSDCFATARAAVAALVGVAVFAALIALAPEILPELFFAKGAIEAVTGRDLLTGAELADWQRVLGVIPFEGAVEEEVATGTRLAREAEILESEASAAREVADLGPGAWSAAAESMSTRAAAYQAQVTGMARGTVYEVNGVRFDGFSEGVLQEAKGPGYASFVRDGKFMPWFEGRSSLLSQAQRQVEAAGDVPIRWYVAEEESADAIRSLLATRGISGIDVVYLPPR